MANEMSTLFDEDKAYNIQLPKSAGRMQLKSNSYEDFVKKFERKKTTDDCYTPQLIMDAVEKWLRDNVSSVKDKRFVRPFWPGMDYKAREYAEDEIVVDNPPFSILAEICRYYESNNIGFFLFCQSITALSSSFKYTTIITDTNITYENGAVIRTAFRSNLFGDVVAMTSISLKKAIEKAEKENHKNVVRQFPKYVYPAEVVTATGLCRLACAGVDLQIRRHECTKINSLEHQRKFGKVIFGSGLLISRQKAEEAKRKLIEAKERKLSTLSDCDESEDSNIFRWQLSERENKILDQLG